MSVATGIETMLERLLEMSAAQQALLAGLFTWAVTAAGAAVVFTTRRMPQAVLESMLGFAAGIMIAASVWSLLLPALERAELQGLSPWVPAATGFLLGGAFLRVADLLLPHLHPGLPRWKAEGVRTTWERTTLLVLAITLHNIPEGLAIGVAFAAAGSQLGVSGGGTLAGAIALTIGIAIQNLPEGIAVAMPLRREGASAPRSFWYGQLSAAVEPVAAVVGAATFTLADGLLPYALAFAAGAMIYVVVEELIPAAHQGGHADLATSSALAGFTLMMVLDVAFG